MSRTRPFPSAQPRNIAARTGSPTGTAKPSPAIDDAELSDRDLDKVAAGIVGPCNMPSRSRST